jgi:hypothetical protein
MLIAGLFHSSGQVPAWSNAVSIGLVAVAGASAGLGFHGGIGTHMRPDTSFERTREK